MSISEEVAVSELCSIFSLYLCISTFTLALKACYVFVNSIAAKNESGCDSKISRRFQLRGLHMLNF